MANIFFYLPPLPFGDDIGDGVTGASKEGEGGGEGGGGGEVEVEDVTITMAGRTTNNKEK